MYENDKKYDTLEKKGEGSLKIHEVIEIPNIKYDFTQGKTVYNTDNTK